MVGVGVTSPLLTPDINQDKVDPSPMFIVYVARPFRTPVSRDSLSAPHFPGGYAKRALPVWSAPVDKHREYMVSYNVDIHADIKSQAWIGEGEAPSFLASY